MRRTLLALILCSVPFVAFAQEAPPAETPETAAPAVLSVDEVTVCRAVEERTPVEAAESFPSDVGSLFCFTKVEGATSPAQTYHRWYVGDTMVREISIIVKT